MFGETVTEADIYRLCLDGKLTLSVVFIDGHLASSCTLIEDESLVEYLEVPSLSGVGTVRFPVGGQLIYGPSGHMYQCRDTILGLEEDWPYDLVMIGGERFTIEENYWRLAGGNKEELTSMSGTFVSEGNVIFQLKGTLPHPKGENARFYPLGTLPENKLIVVRTKALLELEQSVAGRPATVESQLLPTERNSLLVIIAALCKSAGIIDHQARGVAPQIVKMADAIGVPLDAGTVLTALKRIPDAVGARQR